MSRDDDQDAFHSPAGFDGGDLLSGAEEDLFGSAPVTPPAPPAPKPVASNPAPQDSGTVSEKPARKPRKKALETTDGQPGGEAVEPQPAVEANVSAAPAASPLVATAALETTESTRTESPKESTSAAPSPQNPAALTSLPPRAQTAPDGYVVVARRYRPQTFGQLVGQEAVRNSLCGAIEQGRVGHAFLFSGPRGTGKTSTARILAKALNCMENGPRPDPCGRCASCLSISSGSSLDVIEIDAASNTGVDNIRDLRSGVALAPFSRYKVYIIDEVHMLSTGAFNALLKTLEEPPGQVVFVLATTEIHKVPETIVSRCQSFQFRRFTESELTGQLGYILDTELGRRGVQVDPEDRRKILDLLARSADGGMRDAQVLLDQILVLATDHLDYETVRRFVGAVDTGRLDGFVGMLYDRKTPELLGFIGEMVDAGQDLEVFTKSLVEECRSLLVLKAAPDTAGLVHASPERLEECVALAGRLPVAFLVDLSEQAVALTEAMKTAANPRFLLELFVVRLTRIRPVDDLDKILRRIEELEKSITSGNPGSARGAATTGGGVRNEQQSAETDRPVPVVPRSEPASISTSSTPSPVPVAVPASPKTVPSTSSASETQFAGPSPESRDMKSEALKWADKHASMSLMAFQETGVRAEGKRLIVSVPRSAAPAMAQLQRLEGRGGLTQMATDLLGAGARAFLTTVETLAQPRSAPEDTPSAAAYNDNGDDEVGEEPDSYDGVSPFSPQSSSREEADRLQLEREIAAHRGNQKKVYTGKQALEIIEHDPELKSLLDNIREQVGIDESGIELRVDGHAA